MDTILIDKEKEELFTSLRKLTSARIEFQIEHRRLGRVPTSSRRGPRRRRPNPLPARPGGGSRPPPASSCRAASWQRKTGSPAPLHEPAPVDGGRSGR